MNEIIEKVKEFSESIVPELTTQELKERIVVLYRQNLELTYMVENGLGFEDLINDISPMHEVTR